MKKHGLLQTQYKRAKKKYPPIFEQKMPISKWVKWEAMRKIRTLKKDKNWSWERIGKELGTSKRTLLRWNNQQTTKPTINKSHLGEILGLLYRNDYFPKISRALSFSICFEDWWENADRYKEFNRIYSKYYRNPPRKK